MLYLLVYILFPLLIGFLFWFWGSYLLKYREADLRVKQKMNLQQKLLSWQIEGDISLQTLRDVNKSLNTVMACMIVGGGTGLVLIAMVMACIALLTTGTLLAGNLPSGEPFVEIILLLWFVGYALGAMAGFSKLRCESLSHIAFGDLRRRLAADYRSLLWQAIPVLLAIINCAVVLLNLSSLHDPVRVLFMNNVVVELPRWILLPLPIAMVLLVIGVEVSVGRIVRFPRLLVTAELGLAHRIDDMLRAIIISGLIGSEYCIVGSLQMEQYRLLFISFSINASVEIAATFSMWLFLSYLVGLALVIVGVGFGTLQGHLGGSISGWSKKRMKGGLDGAASTDR